MTASLPAFHHIAAQVAQALTEDIASGDVTASLIPADRQGQAQVIARESLVVCGQAWFNECFRQLNPECQIDWQVAEGSTQTANTVLCHITGPARALLSAERSALNFLQTLSATATETRRYVDAIAGLPCQIMDTRKTLPGLRLAQKYAVTVGGGVNQRVGLYDGVLIKENHILAAGSITAALAQAKCDIPPHIPVQIEVENHAELEEALTAGATLILLDNMDYSQLRQAVALTAGRAQLEASGNVNLETVREIAATGVDRISIGGLTKHVQAIDLSMRFTF
ncbi:carboxylating nicotinate-nucleotide diphosphorylase [Aquaspirillum serpens]|uniref:carboxylating nicotinate-nucleotide diphosphorylase n=1 Tax=Aquaspirillum serpens TaxID=190 RepID=UPI0003B60588|nr:carboxylating nicotinate-nucleotide diphosphorylase [Aquaspirillum serpens]